MAPNDADAQLQQRWELSVYNESCAFVIMSRSLAGRGFFPAPDDEGWRAAIEARTLLPIGLVQDDELIVRVVLGGTLEAVETSEAVARLETTLHIEDELALAGSAALIIEGEAFARDCSVFLPVPAGRYRAVLLSYLPGVNGDECLRKAGRDPETLREWFAETRPAMPPPPWLLEQVHDTRYVDFLLHLTRDDANPPLPLPRFDVSGCVAYDAGARLPERCPLGLVARVTRPADDASEFPWRPLDAPPPPLAEPLRLPLSSLEALFMIAHLANEGVRPELRVELPDGAAFAPTWPADQPLPIVVGQRLRLDAPPIVDRWTGLHMVRAFSPALAQLPDGSVVELASRDRFADVAGWQRYRGTVAGGVLVIDGAEPNVQPHVLADALALTTAIASGRALPLADEQLALDVLEEMRVRHGLVFRKSVLAVQDAQLTLTPPDSRLLTFVARSIFARRFAEVWKLAPLQPPSSPPRGRVERVERRFVGDHIAQAAGTLLLSGRSGNFTHGDVTLARMTAAERDALDAELATAGFAALGDLAYSKAPGLVLRAYRHEAGDAFGLYWVGARPLAYFNVVSVLADGARLTTSTFANEKLAAVDVNEQRKTYVYRHAELPVTQPGNAIVLVTRHQTTRAELVRKHGQPIAAPTTLADIAQSIDDAFAA